MGLEDELVQNLDESEQYVQVLSVDDLIKEWEAQKSTIKTIASYYSAAMDANTARKLLQEFGIRSQQVVIKTYNGKRYVIFKGYPGLRKILKGTRYLQNNPKVVRMAIGPKGIIKSAKGGFVITVVLSVGIEVFDYMIRDEATLSTLFGTVTADVVKIGLSSIAGAVAGLAVGSAAVIGSVAGAPLIAAIAVGIATGLVLDRIDRKIGATAALIKYYESVGVAFDRKVKEIEYETNWFFNQLNDPCVLMAIFGGRGFCRGY